ncbi:MAG: hypothetical protein HY966_05355, partial [Ignavibacteriales bacterium]|nr:hypothetical protein [Ignavibacteriales bacterium]
VKFRDPETTSENTYNQPTVVIEGKTIPLPADPIKTKINVDGMTLSLGALLEL